MPDIPPTQTRWIRFLHIATICYWIFLTMLLWAPDPRGLLFGWQPTEGPGGSLSHLIAFSLLGFFVELGRRRKSFSFWILILIGYVFLTEIVQEFIPPRSFEWQDIFQDLFGILIGLCLAIPTRYGLSIFGFDKDQ